MSFAVNILQRPVDMEPKVITVELSSDELQTKLNKNMKNILSINGTTVTMPQKVALAQIGRNRPISSVDGNSNELLVTARFGGRLRTLGIRPDGSAVLLDNWNKSIIRSRTLPSREFGRT